MKQTRLGSQALGDRVEDDFHLDIRLMISWPRNYLATTTRSPLQAAEIIERRGHFARQSMYMLMTRIKPGLGPVDGTCAQMTTEHVMGSRVWKSIGQGKQV